MKEVAFYFTIGIFAVSQTRKTQLDCTIVEQREGKNSNAACSRLRKDRKTNGGKEGRRDGRKEGRKEGKIEEKQLEPKRERRTENPTSSID